MKLNMSPRGKIVLIGVALFVIIFLAWIMLTYNALVAKDQSVLAQWAQVENQYQRKIDLIPNLVAIVSQYTQFERSTLENITRLRSQWQNASGIDQRINISQALDQNLYSIRITYEAYPELQSIQLVSDLMISLEGTENRIATERGRYNDNVRGFNTAVLSFPSNLVAGMFGFHERPYYAPFPGGPV